MNPTLLRSLQQIVSDAERATEADDIALAAEQPVFSRLLDASLPTFPMHRRAAQQRIASGVQPVGRRKRKTFDA